MQISFPVERSPVLLKNNWLLPVAISLTMHALMLVNFKKQEYKQSFFTPSMLTFSITKSSLANSSFAKSSVVKPTQKTKDAIYNNVSIQNEREHSIPEKGNDETKDIPIINAEELGELSISPQYPRRAVDFGWEGKTVVLVKIINGIKHEIELQISSGYRILDDSAISAVQSWNIPQNIQGGKYWVRIPIEFKIKQD